MPEAYSKPCQISRMMRHIENPGIVKTVYSCIFGDINNIQPCSDISRDIKAYSGIFKHCWSSWSHIQTFRTMCNPCIWVKVFENGPSKICERQPLKNLKLYGLPGRPIYIFAIFKTLTYSKLEASSKACRTCEMIRHIQSPDIFRTLLKHF